MKQFRFSVPTRGRGTYNITIVLVEYPTPVHGATAAATME